MDNLFLILDLNRSRKQKSLMFLNTNQIWCKVGELSKLHLILDHCPITKDQLHKLGLLLPLDTQERTSYRKQP